MFDRRFVELTSNEGHGTNIWDNGRLCKIMVICFVVMKKEGDISYICSNLEETIKKKKEQRG